VNLAALAYIKPGSSTELPLPAGIATCDDASGGSILKWVFPTPDLADAYSIDVDQTLSLIYTMKVPDEAAAGTNYANTAGVRQFEAFTDIPGITATYIPAENIDPTQDPKADSPPLKDPSNVFIPGAEVAKDAETSLTETNNNFKTQATIGETITYTYEVTVQKGTTVYRGVLSDALPTGIDFVSLVKAELVGSSTPLPDLGFTIDATNGTLTFPVKWINDTSGDQTFRVTVTAKVGQAAATCGQATCTLPTQTVANNVKRTNTAKFESFTAESGGTKTETTTPYDMFVMQPSPSITKTANPTSVTSTATDITYTLRASSSGTRPPLHDVTIVDCVPDTLTVKTVNNGGTLGTNPNCDTSDKVSITWGPSTR
jgi:fimbrial isopeptide formation D2 family protein